MTYDLALFQGETGLLDQSIAQEQVPYLLSGIRKAAQAWLIAILTSEGSSLYRSAYGSSLLPGIREGLIQSELSLAAAFYLADETVRSYLSERQDDNTPSDEKLVKSDLISIEIFGDQAVLSVQLNSEAGDQRKIQLPVRAIP